MENICGGKLRGVTGQSQRAQGKGEGPGKQEAMRAGNEGPDDLFFGLSQVPGGTPPCNVCHSVRGRYSISLMGNI